MRGGPKESRKRGLGLFADRTSTATMRANQLRLWFAAIAYVLVNELRRTGLRGTELARAQVTTIRCRLLKIGTRVTVSVRRIVAALSSAVPLQPLFAHVLANLQRAYPLRILAPPAPSDVKAIPSAEVEVRSQSEKALVSTLENAAALRTTVRTGARSLPKSDRGSFSLDRPPFLNLGEKCGLTSATAPSRATRLPTTA